MYPLGMRFDLQWALNRSPETRHRFRLGRIRLIDGNCFPVWRRLGRISSNHIPRVSPLANVIEHLNLSFWFRRLFYVYREWAVSGWKSRMMKLGRRFRLLDTIIIGTMPKTVPVTVSLYIYEASEFFLSLVYFFFYWLPNRGWFSILDCRVYDSRV